LDKPSIGAIDSSGLEPPTPSTETGSAGGGPGRPPVRTAIGDPSQPPPDEDREVIEAAYRQLMRKYHPDVGGADPDSVARAHERAKAINQAYSVLRDPLQRRIYDGMRQSGSTRSSPRPRATSDPSTVEAAWEATSRPREEEHAGHGVYTVGALRLDIGMRRLTRAGRAIDVSAREFDILRLLAKAAGRVVDRQTYLPASGDRRSMGTSARSTSMSA
jgi:curved DNA-binding protein CbpA